MLKGGSFIHISLRKVVFYINYFNMFWFFWIRTYFINSAIRKGWLNYYFLSRKALDSKQKDTIPSKSSQVHNTAACFPSNDQKGIELDRTHCHQDCLYHHQWKARPGRKWITLLNWFLEKIIPVSCHGIQHYN